MSRGFADSATKTDYLGVERYFDGLARFIMDCETPMTMSIQGDWGTGKTSSLNIIEKKLKDSKDVKCHVLWFNTWQYSQCGMENNMTLALMANLYTLLKGLARDKHVKVQDIAFPALMLQGSRDFIHMALDSNFGGAVADRGKKVMDAMFGIEEFQSVTGQIETLKKNVQDLIDRIILDSSNERIVVYVDDLDRLEPQTAVELLEGIKNFMDCRKCVFVLAVDSQVIYQGIESKYGKEIGQDKAKKFFDKIIQVPFYLPVGQYNITTYIRETFLKDTSDEYAEHYERATSLLLGNNPRSIKRAFNLFQLYEIIMGPIVRTETDRIYLFNILLIQMNDELLYRKIVSVANKNTKKAREELRKQEYDIVRQALDLPLITEEEEDSSESIEAEERWNSFIELLVETSRISSAGATKEETQAAAESNAEESASSTELTGEVEEEKHEAAAVVTSSASTNVVKWIMNELETLYTRKNVNDNLINFVTQEGATKCSFRVKTSHIANVVIYQIGEETFEELSNDRVHNRREVEEFDSSDIGYFYTDKEKNSYVTLTNICDTTDRDLLKSILVHYHVFDS